nr:hypothetical protein [Tanacetum cinerariifolium]
MDLKWQMTMLSVRVHKFEQKAGRKIDFDKKESARFNKKKIKEIGKKEEDSKALIIVETLVDWTNHDGESDGVIASKEFGMIAGCDTEDAIEEGAAKIYNLITGVDTEGASTAGDAGEFALMGVTSELTLEDKIRVLSIELENTFNLLKHSERTNADVETAKKELQTKLDNHLVQTEKWRISSKNLFRLINSSMSVRTKVGLGFNNYIRENELGWDDSVISIFTTNSEYAKGRPLFNRFAKADSMKDVPPPLSGDYTSLSDHIDMDESHMSYGTKFSTSSDSKSMSNDFVSCDDSDKSSEVNTTDFASSDSSIKSSEPNPNDSTSCASTFSVSTSENEAEIESNVGTPIQEPIIDCDFYEKQMVNKTVGIRVGPVHSRNKVNHQNQFVLQVLLLRTGNVNIPPVRPQPVPTDAEDEGVFDSGCSRSMTDNKESLDDFQICDKKNIVLITDTECLVLSKDFKLPAEKHKDEIYPILKDFINLVENQLNKKVKAMRCDNVQAYKNSLKTLEKQKRVLQRNQLTLEDKIRVLSIELENTFNLLKHSERTNADVETAKKELQTKLDNHLVQTEKWRISSKNLFRLIDNSMSVRTKVGLGFNNYIRENELGWDDSVISVFTTNSEYAKGRPLFNRFAKADSMKGVPPPFSGDYTSLSDHIDMDESHMSYGTKFSTSSDSKSMSNDFISCDDSDKSSEVNTTDFTSSDSSIKSSEPKPNDSTSCASTSSVSTSENKAEIESNVGTPIQELIIVQDLPSFSCNSSDKNENTSRTSCNKNGYFNKKACHFEKTASSVSKLCFVCGSGTHLIKDCDFYEKQMVNKTVGIIVGPVHSRNKVNHQNQTGKVNIPPARPQPVPTGKPKENPFPDAEDEGVFDSGCSRSMAGNKESLDDFQVFQGEKVMFEGGEGRITGKGTIRTPTLDFENVYYVKELQKFNLFSISQICDKKNIVLITDTECLVLSKDFKLPAEKHKDEIYPILKDFINLVENQLNKKVKAIRCDNGTEFKNAHIIELCGSKGIKREVYNLPNKRVEETMNLRYLKEKPNIQGLGHEWYFDLDYLTDTLGYKHDKANQSAGTQKAKTNPAGTQDGDSDSDRDEQVIIVPSYPSHNIQGTKPKDTSGDEVDGSPLNSTNEIFQNELARLKGQEQRATSDAEKLGLGFENDAEKLQKRASAKTVPPGSIPLHIGSIPVPAGDTMVSTDDVPVHTSSSTDLFFDNEPTTRFPSPSDLGNHDPSPGIFSSSSYDDEFGAALNNVASTVEVSLVATKRINTIHPQSLIIGDHTLAMQMRSKVQKTTTGESAFISYIYDQQRDNYTDFQHYLFACFLSQVEPSNVAQALEDLSWVDAMQEEMQQFKFQNVWVLVDLSEGKYAIGTKWILKNKKDAEGIVMDVKSAFLYKRIDEEVYVTQPKVFLDPQHPKKVYKVVKALYGLHQVPRAWYATLSIFLLKHAYRRGTIDKTLFLKKNKSDIILVQVYVDNIIFGSTKKAWCDEFEALMKGEFQISAMGELTFFLASRPDIIFAVSACSRNQVTPTTSNLEAVKKIFKYLKGQPKLGLWYPKESPLVLEAYSDSDYAGANKDRKSTTGGCQFLAQNLNPSSISSMAALRYKDEHNKVGYLLKPTGSDDYHQIIDFLRACHIWYAITHNPIFFDSLVKQFWSTAKLKSPELADDEGIDDLPIVEIYFRMDNLGPLVVALIYLSDRRLFNWSSNIFKGMVSNIGNAKKFLMYPRFLQAILGIETRIKRQYKVLMFYSKLFANMRLNFEGQPMPLLPAMLVQDKEGEGAWKVNSLETELKDHNKLFKDVVGKLVKKVKAIEQDVDLDALLALANTALTVDSNISPGGTSANPAASTSVPADVPTSATIPTGSTSVPADVPTGVTPVGVSNKGKALMVEEDFTVKERTFKQMEEDRLGEQAAKRLHDEEHAQVDRQRAELYKRRQQEVLNSTMYYTKANWIHIMAQVEANASLSKTLLGDDVFEDNFPARMAVLIKRKKQVVTKKLEKERRNRPMNQGQQRTYMRQFVKNQIVSSPTSSGTRRKSLSRKRLTKLKSKLQELDLDADAQTFIKVVSDEDSKDKAPLLWSPLVGWEILHMVDRQDLVKLYGLVVKYYENHPVAGAGLILWGDLQVVYMFADVSYPFFVKLMERMLKYKLEIDKDVIGNDITTAEQLIRFIKNQLAAAQFKHADVALSRDIPLICADFSSILVMPQSSRYIVPTGRVVVPTGRYVVPAGNVIVVSTGRVLCP